MELRWGRETCGPPIAPLLATFSVVRECLLTSAFEVEYFVSFVYRSWW